MESWCKVLAWSSIWSGALWAFPAVGQRPPEARAAAAGLEVRVEPMMALHSWMRQLAETRGEPPQEAARAVAVVRRVGGELGGWLGWGLVDGLLPGVKDSAGLARLAQELPEERSLRGGGTVRLRAGVGDLAAAYGEREPSFLAQTWPAWKKDLDRLAAELNASLIPKVPQVWADFERHLDLRAPQESIPVYLVVEAPFPGAVTFRSRGGPVAALSLGKKPRGLHEEMVLHELLHALDVLTPSGGVLNDLRSRLEAVPGSTPNAVHDYVHTLMFAQAAGTTRALFDPRHKDYGEVDGYYPKVPEAAAVVVPAWRSYLQGELARAAALDQIVAGFAARAAEKTKGGPQAAPKKEGGGG